jgi:Protein of unknown function (DUF4238)
MSSGPAAMAQDHFVAQTYLKHFGDATRDGMLHAYRKRDGKYFPCWPRDVCREWEGDLNRLLERKELLGDFRRLAEPYWNPSVANLLAGNISYHDKFVVAIYMANLMTCTPAWRRVGVSQHNQMYLLWLAFSKRMKEKHGGQPNLPVEGIAMLERGELKLDTDPDYIKGLVTRNLMQYTWVIYNQNWTVLRNETAQPFITSDNPVALLYSGAAGEPVRRFLPITPHLCLTIQFDPRANPAVERLTPQELEAGLQRPPGGSITHARCNSQLARFINRVQVQSAEELAFSPQLSEGIQRLVKKYAKFRLDVDCKEFPDPSGAEDSVIQGSILQVREVTE